MARTVHAWGIDIGKCGLKAIRCRISPTDPRKLLAESFDYIQYPMILSQPEADATELVREALTEFTSRNDLTGDRVVVSIPGTSGLSKFVKLPPIEPRKIPDIVRYEARQQIPFPLNQVVWDWQRLPGGTEESGFVFDAEVAIFAIRQEQVQRQLAPLVEAGIEVDSLQLGPIALANMLMFDQLPSLRAAAADPDAPVPSVVLVSIGVDTTDLVVTNGSRIWQRSMPIGGSAFTKALVREMRLTYSKAEHLKRNAVRAQDPKAVFRAMRPVFAEFTTELQRSLNYCTGADRTITIGKVLLAGNAARLRGLADYVSKQLALDVRRLEHYAALDGPTVLSAPAFRENRLGFAAAYGLALQGAGAATLRTSLLPGANVRGRMIAAKRPWAVGALSGLLVAAVMNFFGMFLAWSTYADARYDAVAFTRADAVKNRSTGAASKLDESRRKQTEAAGWQRYLVEVQGRRFQVLDMLRAVQSLMPRGELDAPNPADRQELHVDAVDFQYYPELGNWFFMVKGKWAETLAFEAKAAAAQAAPAAEPKPGAPPPPPPPPPPPAAPVQPPACPGWVIQIVGHHFHNGGLEEGEQFVRTTLIRSLLGKGASVRITAGGQAGAEVPVSQLGIGYPIIVSSSPIREVGMMPLPATAEAGGVARPQVALRRYDFVVQYVWQPPLPAGALPATGQ